jgi:hypothetical protein
MHFLMEMQDLNPEDYDKGAPSMMLNARKIKMMMLEKKMHQRKEAEEGTKEGRKEG